MKNKIGDWNYLQGYLFTSIKMHEVFFFIFPHHSYNGVWRTSFAPFLNYCRRRLPKWKKKNFLRFYFDDFLLSVHLITHFNDITIYIWHYSPVYLAKINVGEMTARECFICRRSKTWISLYKLILFILLFSLSLFKHFSFFSTVSSTPPESWFWFLFFTFFYCILYSFIFSPIFLTIFIIKLS